MSARTKTTIDGAISWLKTSGVPAALLNTRITQGMTMLDERPSLHTYMTASEPELALDDLDDLDQPDVPSTRPLTERFSSRPDERLFVRLIERLEQQSTDRIAIEQSMLGAMNVLIERVARYSTQTVNTQDAMQEMLAMHRATLRQIGESQAQITMMQGKLLTMLVALTERLAAPDRRKRHATV